MTEVREMTRTTPSWARRVISSSVMPSAKYCCEESCEMFCSGKTASEVIFPPPAAR
jgi:hypothetical protein